MLTQLLRSSNFSWLYRYKLYHIPFWVAYHYAWWAVTVGSAWEAAHNILFSPYTIKFSFYVTFQAIGVYFNLYFLIPRFLEKGRYAVYISWLLLTIICTAACIAGGYYVNAWWSELSFQELFGMEPDQYLYFFKNNALPSTAASMTLAMSIKLTKNWIQSRQREQLLEKEKLETELKFLRSQFHPHFLFNTINSIFVLIHKNPDMASEALAKFSDLLRYQLYECNEAEISLRQELTYLENFIELEKLRHDNEDLEVQVQLEIPPSNELTIVPFVLISFIENAFKHVSQSKAQPNWIKIKLWLEGLQLHASISNSIAPNTQRIPEEHTDHGLGLQQVRRRLNLLYQETHELHIRQSVFAFQVDLQLRLHEAPLTSSPALAADLITR